MKNQQQIIAVLLIAFSVVSQSAIATEPPAKVETTTAYKVLGLEVPVISSVDDVDKYVGRLVVIRGKVSNTKLQHIIGVWVDAPDELRIAETEAYAVGILKKFTVTEETIRSRKEYARKSGNLVGIAASDRLGDHYTLYAELTGKLAVARPIAKEVAK